MPKKKKSKNNVTSNRELVFKEDGMEYCKVTKMLGDARLEGICSDGKTRVCKIRGSMSKRRKVWISVDDYVLVSLRDFQDEKADVIWKYNKDEVKQLKKYGEIETEKEAEEQDIGFEFGVIEEDEEEGLGDIDIDNI